MSARIEAHAQVRLYKKSLSTGKNFREPLYDCRFQGRCHFLPDLARSRDISFVKATRKDYYVDWGRDHWDPGLMFKMVVRQFPYHLSGREIEEHCIWNLMVKCFLDLSAEAWPPDHTTHAASGWV